jgi:hypothetical protein
VFFSLKNRPTHRDREPRLSEIFSLPFPSASAYARFKVFIVYCSLSKDKRKEAAHLLVRFYASVQRTADFIQWAVLDDIHSTGTIRFPFLF